MNVPVVCVSLQVEDSLTSNQVGLPTDKQVNFELSREALATMLDGFGRIKDQLRNMA